MFRPDVSVEEMAKRADYPVYLFGHDPSWSTRRQIVDILDVATPPHRMFAAVYPAKDKRHIVLMQSHTFNANLAPMARAGKLLYTSPAGIKVLSSKDDKSMAKILLSSVGSTRPSSPTRRPRIAPAICWRRPRGPSPPSPSTGS